MLITIYKACVWLNKNCGDVLQDEAFNNFFKEKLESTPYITCLTLTEAIKGTLLEKTYQKLKLKSL